MANTTNMPDPEDTVADTSALKEDELDQVAGGGQNPDAPPPTAGWDRVRNEN